MAANPRVVITSSATPSAGGPLSNARVANEDAALALVKRRKQIHREAAQEIAAGSGQEVEDVSPPPEREDLESIEIPLRDGRIITYGPPSGISLADRIARMYTGRDHSMTEYRLTRILMGVQAIDGQMVKPIANEIERSMLANRVGDEAIDLLVYFDRLYWPPMTQAELPLVKKNPRSL